MVRPQRQQQRVLWRGGGGVHSLRGPEGHRLSLYVTHRRLPAKPSDVSHDSTC